MNKTERAYSLQLDAGIASGEVLSWQFEAITLVLPGGVRYTPDFFVMRADRSILFVEVKGAAAIFADDSKAKFRIASAVFPMFDFTAVAPMPKSRGGGWAVIYPKPARGDCNAG